MALQLTLPAVTIGNLQIPERTFTEGIDFEIGSILQEGETTYREEMVAIVPTGNNSQVFRDYAQHIGNQRAVLTIDIPEVPTARPVVPPGEELPDIPGDFTRTALTHNSVTLTWTAAAHAAGYDLFFSTSSSRPTRRTTPTLSIGNVQTYTRTGLTPETTYYAYLRGRNGNGTSDWTSGEVFTTAAAPVVAPTAVTGFGSTASTYNSITYGWTAVSGATGYDLYFSESSTAPAADASPTTSVGAVRAYTRTGLTGSTGYYAYIRATNSAGSSAWSAAVMVTTPIAPVVVPTGFAGNAVASDSIAYTWDVVEGATGYDLYVTTSAVAPTPSTTPTASVLAVATYTQTGLFGSTEYYAYIRAKNNVGPSAWSGAVRVTTLLQRPEAPAGFMGTAETHDSIQYIWEVTPVATGYDLFFSPMGMVPTAETEPSISVGAITGYRRTGLSPSTEYRAYIRATNSAGASVWTSADVVTTPVLPAPPVPEDFRSTSVAYNSITWAWSEAPRATGYDLYVTTSAEAPAADATPTASVGAVTDYQSTGLSASTTYRAYLRAKNDTGTSDWSGAVTVITALAPPIPPPNVPADFVSTASTSTSISYGWSAAFSATGYDLYITTDTAPPGDGTAPTVSVGAITNYIRTGLSASTEYRAYIRAKNEDGRSAWSASLTVTTPAVPARAPGVPTNFAFSSSTHDTITYGWDATTGATGYDLYIATSATAPTPQTAPTVSVGAVTTYVRTGLSGETTYRAYLRATNDAGASAWTSVVAATTPVTPRAPAVPTGFSSTAATQNSLTYGWDASTGATGYDLYITVSTTPPTALTAPTISVGAVTTYTRTGLSTSTVYRAYLRATNDIGASDWTSVVTTTTAAAPGQPPGVPMDFALLSKTESSITYQWTATGGATGYDLYVTTSATTPTAQTTPTTTVGAVTTGTVTGLESDQTYFAYIRARNSVGTSDWSNFVAEITFVAAIPEVPRHINFHLFVIEGSNAVDVYWDKVFNAVEYDVYLSTNQTPPTVSTTATATVSQPPGRFPRIVNYQQRGLTLNETYFLYVRARNALGISDWSDVVAFNYSFPMPEPTPLAPGGLHIVAEGEGFVILGWNEAQWGQFYDVYVTSSTTPPSASTTPTEIVPGQIAKRVDGLFQETTYRGYVRARNSSGASPWTSAVTFTTDPVRFTNLPPVPTGFILSSHLHNRISYEWNITPRARGYDLYLSTDAVAPAADTSPTVSLGNVTNYTFEDLSPNTTYRAYLRAQNVAGRTAWTSAITTTTRMSRIPDVPEDFEVSEYRFNEFTVAWGETEFATGYDLYLTTSLADVPGARTAPTNSVGAVTTYRQTGLSRNTLYRIFVRAKNDTGASAWSSALTVTTRTGQTLPPIPADFRFTSRAQNSILYRWTPSSLARGYDIYLTTGSEPPTKQTVPTASLGVVGSFFPTNLTPGTTYTAYIRGTRGTAGSTAWSEGLVETTSSPEVPIPLSPVPTSFMSTATTDSSISYSWTASARATGYDLYITTSTVLPTARTTPTVSVGAVTAYTRRGLLANTQYRAYIRAKNSSGTSAWSAVVLARTDFMRLPAPANFRVTDLVTDTLQNQSSGTLRWDAVAGATSYDYWVGFGTDIVPAGNVISLGNVTERDIGPLSRSRAVNYAVRANRNDVAGRWSTTLIIPPPGQQARTPTNFVVTQRTHNSITYSWTKAAVATGYDLYITTSAVPPTVAPGNVSSLGDVNTFTQRSLTPNTTYRAYIRSKDNQGTNAWSSALVANTMSPLTAPPVPTNFRSSDVMLDRAAFRWGASARAEGYDLYITTSAAPPTSGTTPTASVGAVTTYTRTGLVESTAYRAYIRAKNSAGNSDWSNAITFTTPAATQAPAVPAELTFVSREETALTFDWTAVTGAQGYDILLRTSATAPTAQTAPTYAVGIVTRSRRTGLSQGTRYWIYVRAKNSAGASAWSVPLVRTTDSRIAPATPTNLRSSARGGFFITCEWDRSERAYAYEMEVVEPGRQRGAIRIQEPATEGTWVYAFPDRVYEVRISALNRGGSSGNSSPILVRTLAVPNNPYSLRSTASTFNSITLQWVWGDHRARPATGADFYLTTGTESPMDPPNDPMPTASLDSRATGTFGTYTVTGLSDSTTYRIWVRTKNSAGVTRWTSSPTTTGLSVTTPAAPAIPTVPTGFASSASTYNSITYGWTAVTDATGYDLYVTPSATAPTAQTSPTASVGAVTTYTRTGLSASTQYRAYVRAKNSRGTSGWTSAVTVTTPAQPVQAPPVPTNFRSTSTTSSDITFGWTAAARATGYDLYITTSATAPTSSTSPTASVGNVTTYTRTGLSALTQYRAYIRAKNASGNSAWTSVVLAQTSAPPLQVPPVPTGFSTTLSTYNSVRMSWSLVMGATSYDVLVTTSSTVPLSGTSATANVTGTTYTRTGLSESTTYRTYVRARNSAGASAWTSAETVTTRTAPPAIPPVPTNFARSSSTHNSITFGWTAAARATGYDLYITTSATAPTAQTAATASVGAVTTYTRTGLSASTTYRAYIRAKNSSGTSAWTSAVTVATPAAPVLPPAPANFRLSSAGGRSLGWVWDAVAGATHYQVYVSRHIDNPTAQTTPTASRVTHTGYNASSLSSRTTYYAWVRTVTATGTSAWSSRVAGTTV